MEFLFFAKIISIFQKLSNLHMWICMINMKSELTFFKSIAIGILCAYNKK